MRARLLEATVELPGRARLRGHVDHAGLRAGRGQPGRPAAPLPDQERPGRRRRRAPHRACAAPSWPRPPAERAAGAGRGAPAPCCEMLGDHFASPVFTAALELWVAARTDPALLAAVAPLEQRVGRETHRLTVELLGADESRPGVRELVQATLDLVRGLGLANTITDDARRRAPDPRPAGRARSTRDLTGDTDMTDAARRPARRPRRRGRPALERRRRPRRRRAGARRRRPPGWDVATQVAHLLWTDEVARRRAATDKDAWDARRAATRSRTRRVRRRGRRSRSPGSTPEACWPAGGTARDGAAAGARASVPDGREDAVVRPADVGRRRWRPRGSWRPGRTRSTCTRPSASSRERHRPDPARRPPRRPHPRLRLRASTGSTRRPRSSASTSSRRPASIWTWGPEDAAQTRDRRRRTTSACWSPSASTATTPTWSPTGADADALARHRPGLRRPARARGGRPQRPTRPRCGSATAPASTATASARCARCSRAAQLDVLTGDYLAELTMLILGKDTLKDPSLGYARTFVRQVEDCLGLALERGVKIVSNAGGLNPAGLADRLREVAARARARPADRPRRGRRRPRPRACVERRAHRQRLPRRLRHRRRADRRRRHRRHRPGHRRLARRRAGGRAPRLDADVVRRAGRRRRRRPRARVRHPGDRRQLLRLPDAAAPTAGRSGFPIAEIAADGSCVITKHDGTGGAVTVDTVTAQLLYEIQSTRYLGPDVTIHLDTDRARARSAADRVAITGVARRGAARAAQGLRQRARRLPQHRRVRADRARHRRQGRLGARRSSTPRSPRPRSPGPAPRCRRADADTEEGASCLLRCTVKDAAPDPVGRAFTGAAVELALGVLPRLHDDRPARARRRRTASTARSTSTAPAVTHTVVHADGRREVVADPTDFARARTTTAAPRPSPYPAPHRLAHPPRCRSAPSCTPAPATRAATPTSACGSRTTAPTETYDARVTWLAKLITPRKVARAAARGGRPRGRGLRAAQPRRASTC